MLLPSLSSSTSPFFLSLFFTRVQNTHVRYLCHCLYPPLFFFFFFFLSPSFFSFVCLSVSLTLTHSEKHAILYKSLQKSQHHEDKSERIERLETRLTNAGKGVGILENTAGVYQSLLVCWNAGRLHKHFSKLLGKKLHIRSGNGKKGCSLQTWTFSSNVSRHVHSCMLVGSPAARSRTHPPAQETTCPRRCAHSP